MGVEPVDQLGVRVAGGTVEGGRPDLGFRIQPGRICGAFAGGLAGHAGNPGRGLGGAGIRRLPQGENACLRRERGRSGPGWDMERASSGSLGWHARAGGARRISACDGGCTGGGRRAFLGTQGPCGTGTRRYNPPGGAVRPSFRRGTARDEGGAGRGLPSCSPCVGGSPETVPRRGRADFFRRFCPFQAPGGKIKIRRGRRDEAAG